MRSEVLAFAVEPFEHFFAEAGLGGGGGGKGAGGCACLGLCEEGVRD